MSRKKRRPAGSPEPRPARAKAPEADRFRFRLSSPWAVPAILALLTLLYFFDFPLSGKVIYGSDTGTDFHRGKEPFAEKLADYGPGAWKPTLGGYPASEEIRHDYFPTSLLKLFTSYQRHLGWRYILTVFFAGWGMYRYLRVLSLARWPCLWGAVAFMFAPAFLSFTFAGHYAKMAVIALLPWMYLCLHRGMQEGKLSRFLWLALLIGLGAYTPHVQMLQYALIGVGLYFLFQLCLLYRERREKRTLLARTGLFTLAAALGIGIGSEGLFPSYLHATRESKRAEAATAETTGDPLALARSWSLHPEEVGSLLVPEFAGFYNPQQNRDQYWGRNPGKYNSEYFGIVVLLLAVPALWSWRRNPTAAFMGLLFALALAFTLGGHTPVHWIAAHLLPGGKVLRSVGMAAFLFAFPAIVLAATGLHQALTAGEPEKQLFRKRLLIAAAALGGIGALAAAAPHTVLELWTSVLYPEIAAARRQTMLSAAPGLARGGLLALLLCAAAAGLVWALMRHKLSAAAACAGLIALTLAGHLAHRPPLPGLRGPRPLAGHPPREPPHPAVPRVLRRALPRLPAPLAPAAALPGLPPPRRRPGHRLQRLHHPPLRPPHPRVRPGPVHVPGPLLRPRDPLQRRRPAAGRAPAAQPRQRPLAGDPEVPAAADLPVPRGVLRRAAPSLREQRGPCPGTTSPLPSGWKPRRRRS